MSSSAAAVLFEDKYVKLTEEEIEIKWYYFPTATSKHIKYEDIHEFKEVPMSELGITDTKTWGMALSPIWWPCDFGRRNKSTALMFKPMGSSTWAAVTPPKPSEVASIVRRKIREAADGAPIPQEMTSGKH